MRSYLIGALLGCSLGMAVVASGEGLADWLDGANAYGTGLSRQAVEPASQAHPFGLPSLSQGEQP